MMRSRIPTTALPTVTILCDLRPRVYVRSYTGLCLRGVTPSRVLGHTAHRTISPAVPLAWPPGCPVVRQLGPCRKHNISSERGIALDHDVSIGRICSQSEAMPDQFS